MCKHCWAVQARSLYCVHCNIIVKYTKLEEFIKFPAEFASTAEEEDIVLKCAGKILDQQQAAWRQKIQAEREKI